MVSTTDTIREQILQEMQSRLGNGALRASAVEFFAPEAPEPIRGIVDFEDTVEKIEYGACLVSMEVRAERVESLPSGTGRSEYGNALLGEIINDMTGADRTLGGLCHGVDYISGGLITTPEYLPFMGAFATFSVRYSFDIGNPYVNSNPV